MGGSVVDRGEVCDPWHRVKGGQPVTSGLVDGHWGGYLLFEGTTQSLRVFPSL